MKGIEFTKAAENALTSLDSKEQEKAIQLLHVIASNMTDPFLTGKINKLVGFTENIFSVKLNLRLRIIIELHEDKINVVDILNHDLLERYFKRG